MKRKEVQRTGPTKRGNPRLQLSSCGKWKRGKVLGRADQEEDSTDGVDDEVKADELGRL